MPKAIEKRSAHIPFLPIIISLVLEISAAQLWALDGPAAASGARRGVELTFSPPRTAYSPVGIVSALLSGDFDGDSAVDLLAVQEQSGSFLILFADGAGGFIPAPLPLEQHAAHLAWDTVSVGDINEDRIDDIAALFHTESKLLLIAGARSRKVSTTLHRHDAPAGAYGLFVMPQWLGRSAEMLLFKRSQSSVGSLLLVLEMSSKEILQVREGFLDLANSRMHTFFEGSKTTPWIYYEIEEGKRRRFHRVTPTDSKIRIDIPNSKPRGSTLVADFDGNGWSDILAVGGGIPGSWFALSFPEYALEQPSALDLPAEAPAVAADVNGDAKADIIYAVKSNLAVMTNTSPSPAAGLELPAGPLVGAAPVSFAGPADSGPYACIGYHPNSTDGKWGRTWHSCEPNYAAYEVDDTRGGQISCCRLPADDVLSAEYIDVIGVDRCPPQYVYTGIDRTREAMRCTKVNESAYTLGRATPGVYWGIGLSAFENKPGISRDDLPLALRPAVGRLNYSEWDVDGCIGAVPGMLLIATSGTDCSRALFAPLLAKHGGERRPVRMLPDCSTLPDPFKPAAGCVLR